MKDERINVERVNIDTLNVENCVLSIEDRILSEIFKEKGLSKAELSKKTNIVYNAIRANVERMQDKGFLVGRDLEEETFYLTAAGVYELEYRMNKQYFMHLHDILSAHGIDFHTAANYLRKQFYTYYISGEFDETQLLDNFIIWCKYGVSVV